jgi:tetratricopeptide (TPR) repeat protein
MRFSLNLANASRKQLPAVKKELRSKVPLLTRAEIRRHKEPLVKALEAELEEEHRPKGLSIYKKIIDYDSKHKKHFQDRKNDNLLLDVYKLLKRIENQTWNDEVESMVGFVWTIWDLKSDYDWFIEFMLLEATQKITDYKLEGTQTDVITKFTHGLSLDHRVHWWRAAMLHFETALHLALHNEEWTINESKELIIRITLELSSCAVKFSQELRKSGQKKEAVIIAKRALTVLRQDPQVNSLEHEFLAEAEFAACWADSGNYESAVSHYEHAASLAECCEMKEKYCECLIEAAKYYGM